MNKKSLTEADIRTKSITPALDKDKQGSWDLMTQILEEHYFTKGRLIVRGKTVSRGAAKKANYILLYKPNLPIAVIEAKDNNHGVGAGMQQALDYAETLDLPFAYSSNGDAFIEHDRTPGADPVEREIPLDQFPSPDDLWQRYRTAKGYTARQETIATFDYYDDGSGKKPRYYQINAINRTVDKPYEIYLSLYQAVTGVEEASNIYKQFSPEFFDLIIVGECHRGSAAADAAWRQVLEYFTAATQIGLTATPKETRDVSNIEYFGEPIYTYSLRQGINDGFLAPYKVVRIGLDKGLDGWRPEAGKLDKYGFEIEDREYNVRDMDRNLVLEKRTELVAEKITEFLRATDRYAKSIIFCENIDHAERMRQALVNANPDLAAADSKYVMRITAIMDFKRATALFADPDFDGDPVPIYEPGPDDTPVPPDDELEAAGDNVSGEGGVNEPLEPYGLCGEGSLPPTRYYVDDVQVSVATERVQYLDADGRLIIESLTDYSRKTVHKAFATLGDFPTKWDAVDQKKALIDELAAQGLFLDELANQVGQDYDAFDLICHIAYDQPPLTRKERAQGVKKQNVFSKYGEQARAVLEALLGKYADSGIQTVESMEILKVDPLRGFGTPIEIVQLFGGKAGYRSAIRDLEDAIYAIAA